MEYEKNAIVLHELQDETKAIRLENERLAREREDYQAELLNSQEELKKLKDKTKSINCFQLSFLLLFETKRCQTLNFCKFRTDWFFTLYFFVLCFF